MKLEDLQIGQKLLLNGVEYTFANTVGERLPKMGTVPIMVFLSPDESTMQHFTPRVFGFEIEQVREGVYRFATKRSNNLP